MNYWILLTNVHEMDALIEQADSFRYVIAPTRELKKGDTVYLWWSPYKCFYGWGIVAETPMDFIEEEDEVLQKRKRRRQSVLVNRVAGLYPNITEQMMRKDRYLGRMIPTGGDDLEAIRLRPGQASYLNDFIRERNLDAPQGSATTSWFAEENAPRIVMQALLTFGDKTSEGQLVQGVRLPWYEMLRIISADPEEIYNIDPRKFEELIAGAYEREGYIVELTPRSGDKGRDVIATKPGIGSIRIFDQVKRYKISCPVTAEEVAALVGVITMAGNVSKGVITTTSTFAPTLLDNEEIRRLVPHRLELKPRDVLLPWLEGIGLR